MMFAADEAARWILAIAVFGIGVATVEDLRRFSIFSDGGLLSWQVLRLTTPSTYQSRAWRWIGRLLRPAVFRAAFVCRLFAAGALLVMTVAGWTPQVPIVAGCLVLLLLNVMISLRSTGFGLDGAHQMNLLILAHMTVFWAAPPDSALRVWCLVVLGLHAVVAYVASGIYKAIGPLWRNGQAISGIMAAKIYGHRFLGGLVNRHRGLALLMCWSTIVFEISFLAVLFTDGGLLNAFLAVGVLFHVANAVFMGLGGFLFAFTATYPAIVFLNGQSMAILS